MALGITLLLIEDAADDAERVLQELRGGGLEPSVRHVTTEAELRVALTSRWDLVLASSSVPGLSALRVLELLQDAGLDAPLIVLAGAGHEQHAVEAMRAGAHDYLLKGDLARLVPAIERELREARGRAGHRANQTQLATFDRLASIGTLAAGVAHEINNPLAALLADLDNARRDVRAILASFPVGSQAARRAEGIRESIRGAREAADRMRQTARQLSTFSRRSEQPPHPVDAERVLDSSLRMAHTEIRFRARVVREYSGKAVVQATESLLGQVFLNLVINAAQAIVEGDIAHNEIRVSTARQGSRVLVEVRDTGHGILPEHLPHIFEPFYTTKPASVGTGLGLAIGHQIVTSLGGEITVKSEPGRGASFRVALPASDQLPAPARVSLTPNPSPRRGDILVVDDEALVCSALRRMLADHHEVETTTSAEAALLMLKQGRRFDVVLCDLMMPQFSGVDLYHAAARIDPVLANRFVFMTAGAFTPGGAAFLSRVANPRLEKPFLAAALREVVGSMLD